VVVADEVQEPVDHEVGDLAREGPPGGSRLRSGRLDRDVDLPEKEVAGPVGEIAGLGERKGEDVGGVVGLEEIPVQDPDPRIVGEDERYRGARKAQDPERAPEQRPKSGRS
jgi:hypothetical protein